MMKIGIWQPRHSATSVQIYTDHVTAFLRSFGHELIFFSKKDPVPDVDIVWDPTCTGAQYPSKKILRSDLPWIVTVHGASNLSLPLKYTFTSLLEQLIGLYINAKRKLVWSIYKHKVAQVITVSKYAKEELITYLNLDPALISVIYHGYDDDLFFRQSGPKPYLLHVSSYQPKKNVDRIIEAYQAVSLPDKLPLLLVCPGYSKKVADKNITLLTTPVPSKQVAKYLKEAYAFIFPSIHESFGMPLLEAMACGVPVITSNISACPEIVQDAGITVDPYSVPALMAAIEQLLTDQSLHDTLSKNALERAAHFSWEKTARLHEVIFQRFVN